MACVAWTGAQPPNPGVINELNAVATLSSCRAWAVGGYQPAGPGPSQTLIERWNGSAWTRQPSPDPGGSARHNVLNGVAAVSRRNVRAVGSYDNGTFNQTLIEHWNGRRWKKASSPNPVGADVLRGVAATSASNAWAVGTHFNFAASAAQTLILHWNGRAWRQVANPHPGGSLSILNGVAASSACNVWAVGAYNNPGQQTLALHCC